MKLLENINLDTVNISKIETIIKQQNECLLEMYKLLLFDETTAEPDNKAFLETQIKALEHIQKITEKHKQHFSKKEVKKDDKYFDDDNNDDDDMEQESLF